MLFSTSEGPDSHSLVTEVQAIQIFWVNDPGPLSLTSVLSLFPVEMPPITSTFLCNPTDLQDPLLISLSNSYLG